MITTQAELRSFFWDTFPELDRDARMRGTRSKRQNAQSTDCRCAWCDYIGAMARAGHIDEDLAKKATL